MCVFKFLSNLFFNNVSYKMNFSWYLENCVILVWLGIHGLSCRMGYIMPSYTIRKDFKIILVCQYDLNKCYCGVCNCVNYGKFKAETVEKNSWYWICWVLGFSLNVYMRYTWNTNEFYTLSYSGFSSDHINLSPFTWAIPSI